MTCERHDATRHDVMREPGHLTMPIRSDAKPRCSTCRVLQLPDSSAGSRALQPRSRTPQGRIPSCRSPSECRCWCSDSRRCRGFRRRTFRRVVRHALGRDRRFTPHGLRHTFASLHMARGTPLKWIQAQGGWASAKMLLDTYGHHLPTESLGHADALSTAPRRPYAAPRTEVVRTERATPATPNRNKRAIPRTSPAPGGGRAPIRTGDPLLSKAGALTS